MRRLLLFIIASLTWSALLMSQDVYVSNQGDDLNNGSEATPFKTLSKALSAVKGSANGKTIWIKGGTYQFDRAALLDSDHNGLTIRSVEGEQAIFSSGIPVKGHLLKTVTNPEDLARIPEIAQGKVMVAELPSELKAMFPAKSTYNKLAAISWNGYVLNIAQFPNKGYAYLDRNIIETGQAVAYLEPGEELLPYSEANPTGGIFKIQQSIDWNMMKSEFDRNKDMLVEGYLHNDWYFQRERVGGINSGQQSIQLLRHTSYGVGNSKINLDRRVRIMNALCQLDQPGEWYFDSKDGKLYIWPVQPPNSQNPITILSGGDIISATDIQDVTIRGIIFQNFGGRAVYINKCRNSMVAGCTFRAARGRGIAMGNAYQSGVQSCDFYDLEHAFSVTGDKANRKTLTPEYNYARNNHVYNCVAKRGYGFIGAHGVGFDFSNNLIHDLNGSLSHTGNDNIIEYNEFYNMGYEMGDWNPVYTNMDFSQRGVQIRYNFFHHLIETKGAHSVIAVRTDDNGSGFHVESNIMYKAGRSGGSFYGPDNSFSKNVVMEMRYLWNTQQQPYTATPKDQWRDKTVWLQEKYDEYLQLQEDIENGIIDINTKENKIGKAELVFGDSGWVNNATWTAHYPNLANSFVAQDPDKSPWTNCQGDYTKNYKTDYSGQFPWYFHGGNHGEDGVQDFDDVRLMMPLSSDIEMPVNFDPDTVFVDPSSLDFTFDANFDAVEGFEKWDFTRVGLYIDEYRTQVPDKNEYRSAIKAKYAGIPSFQPTSTNEELNERYSDPGYLKLVLEASILSESPVAHYNFDELSGTTAKDIINGNDAEWQSVDANTPERELALVYKGVNLTAGSSDHYFTTNNDPLSGVTEYTISTWVKPQAPNPNNGIVGAGTTSNAWGLAIEGSIIDARFNGFELNSGHSIIADEWNHVAATWSNDGTVKLYLNGAESAISTSGPNTYTGGVWNIGALAEGAGVLSSVVDEISFFEKALDSIEIALLHLNGLNKLSAIAISPIKINNMELNPATLKVRERFTGALTTNVVPNNAADQSVIWESRNSSVISVSESGEILALAPGVSEIIATTNDGGYSDTSTITVVADGEYIIEPPIAYWPFNETSGNIVTDIVGGANGTWQDNENDAVWSAGKFGNSANFAAGDNDRFLVPDDPFSDTTKALSISAWFKMNKATSYKGVVTTRDSEKKNPWGINLQRSHVDVRFNNSSILSDDILIPGKWHNAIITWDTSGTSAFYLDGELVDKQILETKKSYTSYNRWFFGDDICCGSRELDGQIDEVAMYDRALPEDEVTLLYELSKFGASVKDIISTYVEGVEVSPKTVSIAMNNQDTVLATISPELATDKTVIWSSLDESIATVDHQGVILGKQEGEVDIIATTLDGGYTDTVKVNVFRIFPSTITISPNPITIMEEETTLLSATILPENTTDASIVWASENPQIAEVNAYGYVTGVSEGTTNITATTVYGNKVATCPVEVIIIHVDSIVISEKELILAIDETATLTAQVFPDDAENKSFVWSSNDLSVATITTDGVVEGIGNGVTTVLAYTWDLGKTDECIIKVGEYSSLNDMENSNQISVFPNPAISTLHITGLTQDVERIKVYNTQGKIIHQINESFKETVKLNVTDWPQGLYIVEVIYQNKEGVVVNFVR